MANKRNSIMVAIVAAMKNISADNGYHSELGANVYEWRPKIVTDTGAAYVPTEQSELPALHIRDSVDRPLTVEMDGNEEHELTVEFEIAHDGGGTSAAMRNEIADVRKAVSADPTWGGLASDSSRDMPSDTIRLQADRKFFRTLITMKITYSTSAYAEQ